MLSDLVKEKSDSYHEIILIYEIFNRPLMYQMPRPNFSCLVIIWMEGCTE